MTEWLLSVIAGIIVSTLALFLLPEGKMQPVVKTFLGICVFFIMVAPVCKVLSASFDLSLDDVYGSYSVDSSFIEQCRREEIQTTLHNMQQSIEQKYAIKCKFEFSYILQENFTLKVTQVFVFIENIDACNKEVIEDIKQSIQSYFEINTSDIFVYGEGNEGT